MLIVLYDCDGVSVEKMITFFNEERAIWTPWVWGGYGPLDGINLKRIKSINCNTF